MRALEMRNEELLDHNWELREAEERARSLLETQGDIIVRRDSFGRITYANDAFCALIGRPREALIGCVVGLPILEQKSQKIFPFGSVKSILPLLYFELFHLCYRIQRIEN